MDAAALAKVLYEAAEPNSPWPSCDPLYRAVFMAQANAALEWFRALAPASEVGEADMEKARLVMSAHGPLEQSIAHALATERTAATTAALERAAQWVQQRAGYVSAEIDLAAEIRALGRPASGGGDG